MNAGKGAGRAYPLYDLPLVKGEMREARWLGVGQR